VGDVVFLGVEDSETVTGIPADRAGAVGRWINDVATHIGEPAIRPILCKVLVPYAGRREATRAPGRGPARDLRPPDIGRTLLRVGSRKRDLRPAEPDPACAGRSRRIPEDELKLREGGRIIPNLW